MRSDNYKTFMSSIKTQQTISLFTKSFLRRRKFKFPFFRGRSVRFPSFQQINEGAVSLAVFFFLSVWATSASPATEGRIEATQLMASPALLPDLCHLFRSSEIAIPGRAPFSCTRLVISSLFIINEGRCWRTTIR